jgi:hypothetical protein
MQDSSSKRNNPSLDSNQGYESGTDTVKP